MFAKNVVKAIVALAFAAQGASAFAESVDRLYTGEAFAESYRVNEPNTTVRQETINQIVVRPGDKVLFRAGGCAQTGGSGATWKLYVNPDYGSAGIYRGQIRIPGLFYSFTNLQDILPSNQGWSQEYSVAQGGGAVTLGYLDDDYGDNGYWGHDDGTGNQCQNSVNAYIQIYIRRAH